MPQAVCYTLRHMGAKKPRRTRATLDSLAALIAETAASADRKITALADHIAAIEKHLGLDRKAAA